MEITKAILTKNPCYKAGKTIKVKGLMLHSVGCPQPNATAFIKSWNTEHHCSLPALQQPPECCQGCYGRPDCPAFSRAGCCDPGQERGRDHLKEGN